MAVANDLMRLLEAEKSALLETDQQVELHNKYVKDYEVLLQELRSLSTQFEPKRLAPICKVAWLPSACLIHTNEITVLLGDNWFAKMSSTSACDVAKRRIDELKKNISDLDKQKGLIKSQFDFTKDLDVTRESEGLFDEFITEKEYQDFKVKHKRSVLGEQQMQASKAGEGCTSDEQAADVISRLLEESSTDDDDYVVPKTVIPVKFSKIKPSKSKDAPNDDSPRNPGDIVNFQKSQDISKSVSFAGGDSTKNTKFETSSIPSKSILKASSPGPIIPVSLPPKPNQIDPGLNFTIRECCPSTGYSTGNDTSKPRKKSVFKSERS